MRPKIEIIMCTFNGERFISQQLTSILQQSIRPYLITIYDDKSNDSTFRIIKEYERKNSSIVVHQNNTRLGVNKNFEQALKHAHGEYVFLSDQDDIWQQDKIKNQLKIMQSFKQNIPILVHHDSTIINENNKQLIPSYRLFKGYRFPKEKNISHLLHQQGVMGHSIMLNQALIKKVIPFPSSLSYFDRWLSLNAEIYGTRIYIEEPLVCYRIHQRNTSNNMYLNTKFNRLRVKIKQYILPNSLQKTELASIIHLLQQKNIDKVDRNELLNAKRYLDKDYGVIALLNYMQISYLKNFTKRQKLFFIMLYCFS